MVPGRRRMAPMPELPEVETMVRGLRPALSGRTLRAVTLHDPALLRGCDAAGSSRRRGGARGDRRARRGPGGVVARRVVGGVGEISDGEVVFRAGLHPERPASSLTRDEAGRVHAAIAAVLDEAIRAEGSSFDAGYRTVLGLEGGFLAQNAMYGRGGQPCPPCGGAIPKTRTPRVVGRPTHYVPR